MEYLDLNKEDFEGLKYYASSNSENFEEFDADDFEEEFFEEFQIDDESLEDFGTIDEEDLKREKDESFMEDFGLSEDLDSNLFGEEFDEDFDDEDEDL